MRRTIFFFPPVIWAGIVAWLSLIPGNNFPRWPFLTAIHADKWVHIIMYLILSASLVDGFTRFKKAFPTATVQWWLAALALGYGILMEICQELFTTTRSFEVADMVADAVGAVLGIILIRYARKKKGVFNPRIMYFWKNI